MVSLDPKHLREGEAHLLVNTDNWFYDKNGDQYNVVWGKCRVIEAKDVFGFKPSHGTNWYLQSCNGKFYHASIAQ